MTREPTTNNVAPETRDHRLLIGFILGSAVGAVLTMLLAPRVAAELRQRVTTSARKLGRAASDRYQQASARVGGAVDELTRKGQGARDDVLEVVASGAQKVERFAADHMTSGRHTG